MLHREQNWRSAMSIRDVLSNAALFALHASRPRARSARKSNDILCQNCVRYPLKPRPNTVIYRDTPMHIAVASMSRTVKTLSDLVRERPDCGIDQLRRDVSLPFSR